MLPSDRLLLLRHLCSRVRYRSQVREMWGVGGGTLPGVTALFAGQPGTGKSMAAEVIAADLGLDLYRIDLAAVVSKYIGETEKNLERDLRRGRAVRRGAALRRGGRAVRQALRGARTATTATPTSRSPISCSAWSAIGAWPC